MGKATLPGRQGDILASRNPGQAILDPVRRICDEADFLSIPLIRRQC